MIRTADSIAYGDVSRITAILLSFGAPFWFQQLKNIASFAGFADEAENGGAAVSIQVPVAEGKQGLA